MRYNIRDFGAVGDGATLNTSAVQKAIDQCHADGGGIVAVAQGRYLTGTIYLKSHVVLEGMAGAVLAGSPNIADYATDTHKQMYRGEGRLDRCLIFARDATGIGIIGNETIDGQGHRVSFPILLRRQLGKRSPSRPSSCQAARPTASCRPWSGCRARTCLE
ncbi:MAG: glycosyl hydrolase family 28-related protein [Candidatus Sumerlaeota bacterium]|nr:glycosyl hydrolase family 28-related protein [Candidatus Sumerlaeota bacterium]